MDRTFAPADIAHYDSRLAELPTLLASQAAAVQVPGPCD